MGNTITHIRSSGVRTTQPNEQEREFLRRAAEGEFKREFQGLDLRGKVAGKVFSYIDSNTVLHWVNAEGMTRLIDDIRHNRGVYTRAIRMSIERSPPKKLTNAPLGDFF